MRVLLFYWSFRSLSLHFPLPLHLRLSFSSNSFSSHLNYPIPLPPYYFMVITVLIIIAIIMKITTTTNLINRCCPILSLSLYPSLPLTLSPLANCLENKLVQFAVWLKWGTVNERRAPLIEIRRRRLVVTTLPVVSGPVKTVSLWALVSVSQFLKCAHSFVDVTWLRDVPAYLRMFLWRHLPSPSVRREKAQNSGEKGNQRKCEKQS